MEESERAVVRLHASRMALSGFYHPATLEAEDKLSNILQRGDRISPPKASDALAKAQAAARKKREDQAKRLAAAHAKLGTSGHKGANDEDEDAVVKDEVVPYDPYGILSAPKRIPGVALVASGDVEVDRGLR